MKVLVTGGAGFIGSTICSCLSDHGHVPVILDNLSTGCRAFVRDFDFYHGDIADKQLVEQIFKEHQDIYAVVHCAALIVVPDSVANPYVYYQENVIKSIEFIKSVVDQGCSRFIFSSSASVYGHQDTFAIDETASINPMSPYARTKATIEWVLEDFAQAYDLQVISLRYFNPIGADPKMRTGLQLENPSHVLGKIMQAYTNNTVFTITGIDWPTRDGSGIRDYIHVWDLAEAHVKAVEKIDNVDEKYTVINLGTGEGTTVFELVKAFESVTKKTLPKVNVPARLGDVAGVYTVSVRAENLLDWKCRYTLDMGIRSFMEWMSIKNRLISYVS